MTTAAGERVQLLQGHACAGGHAGQRVVRQAIASPLADIMTAIHATLEETPPELAADITTEGVLLAGGGSLLRRFADRVAQETGMPVRLAEDPLTCVATGAGQSLEELDRMGRRGVA